MDRKEWRNRNGRRGNGERTATNKRGWKQELRHLFIHVSIHETRLKDQNEREKRRNNIERGRETSFHGTQVSMHQKSVLEQGFGSSTRNWMLKLEIQKGKGKKRK